MGVVRWVMFPFACIYLSMASFGLGGVVVGDLVREPIWSVPTHTLVDMQHLVHHTSRFKAEVTLVIVVCIIGAK